MLRIKNFCLVSLVGAFLVLGACASSPVPFFSTEDVAEYDDSSLPRGEISLDCESLLCSFRWFTQQSTLAALYDDGDWAALAEKVSDLQYGQDLAYFYLGRAAEERQAYDAAQLYFTRAQSTSLRCSTSLFNRCQGIEVETSSRERADQIAMMLATRDMDLADAQQILSDMGLYTAKVDGIYGPRTRAALHQFQESRRLSKSGKLDEATIRALVAAKSRSRTQVAAATKPKPAPVPAPKPSPAKPTRVAVAKPEPKPAEKPPAKTQSVNPTSSAKATTVARSSAPKTTESSPVVARSTAAETLETTPLTATGPTSEAGSLSVVAISTVPQAAELVPVQARSTAAPTTVAPMVATPVVEATPPAARAVPQSTEVSLLASTSLTDIPAPAAGEPLAEVERIEPRRFAPDREAERTRLKLEVDLLSQADPFAEVLGVVEQGAWVDVLDWGSEWSKVSHGETTGYVYTEVLQ